jgi:hypothetical protein
MCAVLGGAFFLADHLVQHPRDCRPAGALPHMIAGKPREQWTAEEGRNWFLHRLGPRFRAPGVTPPKDPVWHIPTESIRHTTDAAWGL